MLTNLDFFYTFLRGLYFWNYFSVLWLDMLNVSSGLSHVVLTCPHFLFSSFCSHPGWLLCPVTVIQEVVCNEILNIAEKSVHYCSTLSQPVFCHKGPFSDNKSSFIISQQPQVLPLETGLDRNHATREMLTYRALYSYIPQNDDELELRDGDIIDVMEKCDDGWFVGTSRRTQQFGTFPGNYVKLLSL
ncbi:PREDICTED: putative E3 ubiquitin-protein ligase SH3RF2 [Thamnophis sirtalis]|uniref:E3 ubiquitin-protein ligase SH3RF2 n=1 Tax=Thamnophis sirtalis TaxID=35019 RepID=A0A6I9XGK3_9SAUR|nr:PREDICTED: putative E3 ubiquitin-protein ligase SH3RF2 [Thamnophis sirtalis]